MQSKMFSVSFLVWNNIGICYSKCGIYIFIYTYTVYIFFVIIFKMY